MITRFHSSFRRVRRALVLALAPVVVNGCTDLTCNADPGSGPEEGTCNAGPDDLFCSGATKSNGEGYVTCAVNADCTPAVGGGTCTLTKQRECYLNPIEADGTPGIEAAELVSTFCSAPTASGSVNSAGGLPGAGRVQLEGEGRTTALQEHVGCLEVCGRARRPGSHYC